MTCEIRYRIGAEEKLLRCAARAEDDALLAELTEEDGVQKLVLTPKTAVTLSDVVLSQKFDFLSTDALFLNGYQSWTDSEELSVDDVMVGVRRTPVFAQDLLALRSYGDYDFEPYSRKKGELHGFTYAYVRRGEEYTLFGSLNERTGFTAIRFYARQDRVEFSKDCFGLTITQPYEALCVVTLTGGEDAVFDRWFALQGVEPPKAKPITGYTSWYNFYQDISEEKILKNLEAVAASPVDFDVFQIDDGYQPRVGDWLSIDVKKFPNGLKDIVRRTKEAGMLPGIWMAPFACEFKSEMAKQHPDWLLRDESGKPVRGGCNWGGFYVWDFYNPEARDYIRKCLQTAVKDWGFGLLKLDFLYAVCLVPTAERTRGQIMCEAMDFIREVTEGALLLGCGVPLAAAFGKVDYCRIGCDVGLDYDDKLYMRIIHRERVSTKYSTRNTVFRRQLSGRAFWNDPDVFLLRHENISLSWDERVTLARVNAAFGGVLFTSDDVSNYDEKQSAVLEKTLHSGKPKSFTSQRIGKKHRLMIDGEELWLK